MEAKKLVKKIIFSGYIRVKSGLHIGGTNTALNIGGPDSFVVRNPLNNIPYIPGSSLKGKLRSLIEISYGTVEKGGKPSNDESSISGALFGTSGDKDKAHPSRLIVRDAPLCCEESVINNDKYHLRKFDEIDFSQTDLPFTESKTEVTINRITAISNPRTIERVPEGTQFFCSMILNVFEGEEEESLKKTLKRAIKLLEDDYLGGNGSRGYGQVAFDILLETEKRIESYGQDNQEGAPKLFLGNEEWIAKDK